MDAPPRLAAALLGHGAVQALIANFASLELRNVGALPGNSRDHDGRGGDHTPADWFDCNEGLWRVRNEELC
jgi:hypothetical protein